MENPSLVKDLLYSLDMEEVLSKSEQVPEVSAPMNAQHFISISINPVTGKLEGVPQVIREAIAKAGLTEEQVMADPSLAKDLLYEIPIDVVLRQGHVDPDISLPTNVAHNFSIRFNEQTKKFEGVPPAIRKALEGAGLTEEQVLDNPDLAKDILAKFTLTELFGDPGISAPTEPHHHIRISWNPETSRFEGIPDAVREAIAKAGLTEEQVMKEPSLAKEVLYQLSLEDVLKGADVK